MKSEQNLQEFVRETISEATGARFEVIAHSEDHQLPIKDLEWFIRCRNADDIVKIPYVNTAWRSRGEPIFLESLALGDTFDWISSSYGEDAAEESLDFNFSNFGTSKLPSEFEAKYPIVARRIKVCESVAEHVSQEKRVHLELRATGSKGIVVFTLAARIPVQEPAPLKRTIGMAVAALKEGYERAMES